MGSFSDNIIKLALMVPPGRVTTYGRIARAAGGGGMAAQSVTAILGKAYDRGVKNIPFHRIVYADGRIWVDDQWRAARMKLYKKERIKIDGNDRVQDFRNVVFDFD